MVQCWLEQGWKQIIRYNGDWKKILGVFLNQKMNRYKSVALLES